MLRTPSMTPVPGNAWIAAHAPSGSPICWPDGKYTTAGDPFQVLGDAKAAISASRSSTPEKPRDCPEWQLRSSKGWPSTVALREVARARRRGGKRTDREEEKGTRRHERPPVVHGKRPLLRRPSPGSAPPFLAQPSAIAVRCAHSTGPRVGSDFVAWNLAPKERGRASDDGARRQPAERPDEVRRRDVGGAYGGERSLHGAAVDGAPHEGFLVHRDRVEAAADVALGHVERQRRARGHRDLLAPERRQRDVAARRLGRAVAVEARASAHRGGPLQRRSSPSGQRRARARWRPPSMPTTRTCPGAQQRAYQPRISGGARRAGRRNPDTLVSVRPSFLRRAAGAGCSGGGAR